jgi:hypothetical protein
MKMLHLIGKRILKKEINFFNKCFIVEDFNGTKRLVELDKL